MSTDAELTAKVTHIPIDDRRTSDVVYQKPNQKSLALLDFKEGLKNWRIWLLLAYQDIKLRYRRSVLGPFWLTISMAITVYSMGFLYGHLFRANLSQYYPFLVAGMLSWGLISSVIVDQTDAFSTSEGLIKQIKLPYTLYIHRISTRNIIIFFHNIVVMLPVYLIFYDTAKINFYFLLLIPGLILIYINSIFYGLFLAMISIRYRDISQIIKSLIQVIFFMTPVMWNPVILSEKKRLIVNANPFYSFLEIIRAPLLGKAPTLFNLEVVLLLTLIGVLMCVRLFIPYRSRIVYWL